MTSDQTYPATNGDVLYIAEAQNNIFKLSGLSSPNGALTLDNNYANNFLFLISVAIDASDPANPVLYVGDDPGQEGGVAGGGRYYAVSTAPVAPTAPGTPVGVTASAGDSQAFISWLSGGGSPATSYTVRNATASNGILVPDVIVPVGRLQPYAGRQRRRLDQWSFLHLHCFGHERARHQRILSAQQFRYSDRHHGSRSAHRCDCYSGRLAGNHFMDTRRPTMATPPSPATR